MNSSSFAAQEVAGDLNTLLTIGAALGWLVMLALLVAPAWRLVRRRARPLDALWGMLLLGVANRLLSDFVGMEPALAHVAAILLAITLTLVIRSYQRADR